jgi:hypothetical protein
LLAVVVVVVVRLSTFLRLLGVRQWQRFLKLVHGRELHGVALVEVMAYRLFQQQRKLIITEQQATSDPLSPLIVRRPFRDQ